ncbi:MAG: adenylate/guanylate cyclase [Candidatus Electrothrix sp. AR3]|nr:adenylate/guanylate cyclase [Candidatus Electrothrix sp. AR3]
MSDQDIAAIVNSSLDRAEAIWDKVEDKLLFAEFSKSIRAYAHIVPSQIPEHPVVDSDKPEVDEFIALVVDMRKSSRHLMCSIADAKVTQLQRIFYETSALLPAMAKNIYDENGRITEYLGDGLLSIFKVENDSSLYASYNAAVKCIKNVKDIVNPILKERYFLPSISIGCGLAKSKAVVTTVGLYDEYIQPKVFGECVFYASKLSSGNNQIYINESLKGAWPTSKNGTLTFTKKKVKDVVGYLVV